jgi:hypothetical protein
MVSNSATPMASSTRMGGPANVSFVEWSPVIAGAVLAAALSFVLLTFGTAIGLSATSPWPNSGLSTKVLASIAIFYVLVQQIGSLMIGGYVAGRMRTRWAEASTDETDFRDGLHGGLVWAVGVVFSALLVMSAAGSAAQKAADVAGQTAAATAAKSDPMDTVVDTMLRPTAGASAAQPTPSSTAPGAARPRAAAAGGDDARAEVSRILTASVASGSISNENRTYLAQLVAQRAGISQEEAQKRVDAAVNSAREAADKARRAAVLTGFVTAAGLILSLGAAWWAAVMGGNHRDNAIPARFPFDQGRRRQRVS